jgi:hypothetical protein
MAQTKEIKQGDGRFPKDKPHILEEQGGQKQQRTRPAKGNGRATEPATGISRGRNTGDGTENRRTPN